MRIWTQDELDQLISCSKQVAQPMRKQWRAERGNRKNEFILKSDSYEGVFPVYLRINDKFNENFSIGLDYQSPTEPRIHLLRCNGMHEHINKFPELVPHCTFHVHKVKADALNEGNGELNFAEITKEYAAYAEALPHFLNIVNVMKSEISKYFSFQSQLDFELN